MVEDIYGLRLGFQRYFFQKEDLGNYSSRSINFFNLYLTK